MTQVFITGSTGYVGRSLAQALVGRGHFVSGLVRPGSATRLPADCKIVEGNALDRKTCEARISGVHTYVQLVGVAHPSPAKARQFREIDLKSCQESLAAAIGNRVRHFVYVSVAHPAPAMKAYIAVREECEGLIRSSGLAATILRPWYVLGPGHYWPYALKPFYWLARQIPATRSGARRLGLITLPQMVNAIVAAIESPAAGIRIVEVPEMSRLELQGSEIR